MKPCINCKINKPIDEYYKHPQMADGHLNACKECVKARTRARWWKDVAKSREEHSVYGKRSYLKHRERKLAWQKEYYRTHPEAWQRKLERNRAYTKANRDKKNADTIRYRARKKGAPGNATAVQIAARVAYYGYACWICRGPWREIDHYRPITKGGWNWPANLRPICRSCNASKGSQWPYTPPDKFETAKTYSHA